ncbi:hypothetical protein [Ketobacter sp.]|uniref:hypothetical protein n=1 Tax=Ketobacter sp. TaxID=2083498 RepID=UPI000F242C8C|nr:hypothetical protein [Ketobacter sp.]RLT98645.1 MAG: hypothetical protein D9N14_09425 [Ketobacter sp.]
MSACYSGSSDSLREPVALEGFSATVQADLPAGAQVINVAASFYKDGRKQPLVGGDIIEAESDRDAVILRSLENLSGNYRSQLQTDDPAAGVTFTIVHDPEAARADRWYPVDELLVDPGPGELVGLSTGVSFPDPLVLDAPIGNELYTDRSQDIVLTWATSPTTEQIRLSTVQTCYSGDRSVQWGTSAILGATDTGTHTLNLGALIPATNFINSVTNFIDQLSLIIVSSIIEAYSFGLIRPQQIEIETFQLDHCTVSLTIFREISNDLGAGISGGYAIGSTSDTVTVRFQP